ncbi:hypothetical protein DSO57_1020746 [Entomophthora muscae]|uniref:Uncharacterized protein n=1 Tax=Entomophthora muscae TaxID=34485 RepID=A0ACC2RID1_9FUNG|nr:hypothetical protein DSO57_1020746 [Entomophthora muscae]
MGGRYKDNSSSHLKHSFHTIIPSSGRFPIHHSCHPSLKYSLTQPSSVCFIDPPNLNNFCCVANKNLYLTFPSQRNSPSKAESNGQKLVPPGRTRKTPTRSTQRFPLTRKSL